MGGSVALLALYGLRAVRVSYLGSDRFVIREAHGYDMKYGSRSSWFTDAPLASLVVLDRAYCFARVHELYLDDIPLGGQGWEHHKRVAELYDRAATFCAELNARAAGVQAGQAPQTTLLTPAADRPSLSPFDSGCPR